MRNVLNNLLTALLALTFMFVLTITASMLVQMQTDHYTTILKVK
jgi:hypothetical protein